MKYPQKEWKELSLEEDIEKLVKKGKWLGTYDPPAEYPAKPLPDEKAQARKESPK